MDEWRIFGESVWRAPDSALLLWVRCYPTPLFDWSFSELNYSFPAIWNYIIDEIEFRGLLPLRGWAQWYREADHG